MEPKQIYEKLCEIFKFNKEAKIISYDSRSKEKSIYKGILFQLCFLMKWGTTKFDKLENLWFFQANIKENELNLILGIIGSLIHKIEHPDESNKETDIDLVHKFCDLNDRLKFEKFKYLQSIYSNHNNNPGSMILPLIYTLTFNKSFCLSNLKKDFEYMIKGKYDTKEHRDKINYNIINIEFLRYFNAIINSNEEISKNAYDYLCKFGQKKQEEKGEDFVETFSYFNELKDIISDCEKKFHQSIIKTQNKNIPPQHQNSEPKINGASTGSNSSENNSESIQPSNVPKNITEANVKEVSSQNVDKAKDNLYMMLDILNLYDLCSKVSTMFDNMIINKDSIDNYHKNIIEYNERKLQISKLETTISILQNANIINIKRKIAEMIIFGIMEKKKDDILYEGEYIPSKSRLIEFKKILEKIQNKSKGVVNCEEALKRLDNIIGNNTESRIDAKIIVDQKAKNYQKLRVVLDFLRYCKTSLHPYIHGDGDYINYYLLPRCLFNSNIELADYCYSLNDMIKNKEDDYYKVEENSSKTNIIDLVDENIYKLIKKIPINEALEILLSLKAPILFNVNEVHIDKLKSEKEKLKYGLQRFNDYIKLFTENSNLKKYDLKEEIPEQIIEKEKDFNNKLKGFAEQFLSIINDEVNKNDSENCIKDIRKIIDEEIFNSRSYLSVKRDKNGDMAEIGQELMSKIYRLELIVDFINEQSQEFSKRQKQLYKDYLQCVESVLSKSQEIKTLVERKFALGNLNLFDNWMKDCNSKGELNKRYGIQLIQANLIQYIRDFVSQVNLDVHYTFDEKFVLWMIKNDFSQYVKN